MRKRFWIIGLIVSALLLLGPTYNANAYWLTKVQNWFIRDSQIENCPIGAETPSTGAFTTLTGTTVGGITQANLVDKLATEVITGKWTLSKCLASIDADLLATADGTYDLGSTTVEWQDLWIDGEANIDSLVADTADVNGGTIDGATVGAASASTGAFTTLAASGAGTLHETSFSDSDITNVGDIALDTITADDASSFTISSDWTNAGNTVADAGTLTTVDIDGGTITGITDLVVADGGTGVSALTDHCVYVGSGTDAVSEVAVGGANEILCGAAGADPTFRALVDDDIPADIALTNSVINNAAGGSIAVPEKTPVNAVASVGKITSDATAPSDGDTVTIDTKTYTFKTTLTPTEGEVLIGVSAAVALDNLKSAINHTGTPDTDYSCAAVHPTVTATTNTDTTQLVAAKTKGVAGDSIALAKVATHLTVDGVTLGTEVAGVDGTVGVANEICCDATYLYHSVDANTIADANWRRVDLGSAY